MTRGIGSLLCDSSKSLPRSTLNEMTPPKRWMTPNEGSSTITTALPSRRDAQQQAASEPTAAAHAPRPDRRGRREPAGASVAVYFSSSYVGLAGRQVKHLVWHGQKSIEYFAKIRALTLMQSKPKPSLLSGVAVSAATIIISVLSIEKAVDAYLPAPNEWDRRLMFFSEGAVFQNKSWGGFVYQPNAQISSRTIYITDPKILKVADEYQYQIRTNSAGLVQLSDISRTKPSIIFLGDSFTEGQGASPWFYELERRWPETSSYQIINGGILGTGFEAWARLYGDLLSTAKIEKIVVIFISDDWIRPVWQISEHDLECIQRPNRCDGANSFFGLPHNPTDADAEIHRISVERVNYQNILKASAIYQRLLRPAFHLWWPYRNKEKETLFEKSKTAIRQLVGAVGAQNILFIQLPQKDELSSELNNLSERGRNFISQSGFSFVDGLKKCQLTTVDFHTHDAHPNTAGYRKILDCVERSVKEAFNTEAPEHNPSLKRPDISVAPK